MPSSKPSSRRNLSVSQLKHSLEGELDLDLNGWEILGDVMVVELGDGYSAAEKRLLGERIVRLHPKARTVVNRLSIDHELREPTFEVLAGEGTETIYRENGSSYRLDPTKVMFSFGNKEERRRMAHISSPEETVIDMFSCVGQFTIPLAKYSSPRSVIAIEKNPVAHRYLKENITLNKLRNVKPVLGDCREVCPTDGADRVIMGYLFETEKFLPTAINAIVKKGTIHFHMLSTASKLKDRCRRVIKAVSEKTSDATLEKTTRVKSYAPKMYHWVLDIDITR